MNNTHGGSRPMTLGAAIAALAASLGAPLPQAQAAESDVVRGGHKKIEGTAAPIEAAAAEGPKKKIRIGPQKREPGERKFDPPPADATGPPTAKGPSR